MMLEFFSESLTDNIILNKTNTVAKVTVFRTFYKMFSYFRIKSEKSMNDKSPRADKFVDIDVLFPGRKKKYEDH